MVQTSLEHVSPGDLTDDERSTIDKLASVERKSHTPHGYRGMSAAMYHTGTDLYPTICYDEMGLEGRVGDFNAERLGRMLAERYAIEEFREETDYMGEVTSMARRATIDNPTFRERKNQEHVYYEVTVFMHDPAPKK